MEPPIEYERSIYRSCNPDLAELTDEALDEHYRRSGRAEGRRANVLLTRTDFAALVPVEGHALEIGPFHNPLLHGPAVKYFDMLSQADLIERAQAHQLVQTSIPPIDYVSATGDLSIVDETFGYILSSHCIEHQPDLIRHLQAVHSSLADGGRYLLLVPDKRYCFDHFIPESTLAEMLQAHIEGRTAHILRSLLEHRVLTTHNDSVRHWSSDHGVYLHECEARTRAALEEYQVAAGGYIDVHAWFFTPDSFQLALTALKRLGYISLEIERLYPTRRFTNEFWCILRKAAVMPKP